MFVGGNLIRRFDGFRRLCRHAAEPLHDPLKLADEELMVINRVLAGLGGPPARSEVRAALRTDALGLLLLFLLTQEQSCRIGVAGDVRPLEARLKSLAHLLGHGLWPTLSGGAPALAFQEVVRELGSGGVQFRPLVRYDDQGEPEAMERSGAETVLRFGPEGGPYTLAVLLGAGAGPLPVAAPAGGLHPTVLVVD